MLSPSRTIGAAGACDGCGRRPAPRGLRDARTNSGSPSRSCASSSRPRRPGRIADTATVSRADI
jgi:hypothetical protein